MRAFFHTNAVVPVLDRDSPDETRRAGPLLQRHMASGDLRLGTRVLQEFPATVTRKRARPLSGDVTRRRRGQRAALPGVQAHSRPRGEPVWRGPGLGLSSWDARIVQPAVAEGARGACSRRTSRAAARATA